MSQELGPLLRVSQGSNPCQPGLGSHLRLEILFQAYLDWWQKVVPCDCKPGPQFLEVAPLHRQFTPWALAYLRPAQVYFSCFESLPLGKVWRLLRAYRLGQAHLALSPIWLTQSQLIFNFKFISKPLQLWLRMLPNYRSEIYHMHSLAHNC